MKIINNGAPEVLVELANRWNAEGKSFYLGPENIFFYNNQPINYAGSDNVSREAGSWYIYTEDQPLPIYTHLRKEEIEDIAYAFAVNVKSFHTAILTLNYKCNARCCCCSYHGNDHEFYNQNYKCEINTVDLDTAKMWIDKVTAMGVKNIFLGSDGEIFLVPHWKELMSYTASKGLKQIFTTNGTFFDEDVIKTLIELKNVAVVKFSLHALDFETWSKFTGVTNRKLFENAVNAPLRMKKAGITVYINFVQTEVNKGQTKAFLDYWKDKVDGVFVSHCMTLKEHFDNYYDQFNEPVGICEAYMGVLYVLSSGQCIPCCPAVMHYDDKNRQNLPKINLNEANPEDILNMMRDAVKDESFKNICKHCTQFSRRGSKPSQCKISGHDALKVPSAYLVLPSSNKLENKENSKFSSLFGLFKRKA